MMLATSFAFQKDIIKSKQMIMSTCLGALTHHVLPTLSSLVLYFPNLFHVLKFLVLHLDIILSDSQQ
jgi:hypothetical protein